MTAFTDFLRKLLDDYLQQAGIRVMMHVDPALWPEEEQEEHPNVAAALAELDARQSRHRGF